MKSWQKLGVMLSVAMGSLAAAQSPYVKITGTLQGPNGLPAANQIISLTPTQSFFVPNSGTNTCAYDYFLQVNGVTLMPCDIVNFNTTTPVAPTNGINVTFGTSRVSTTDSVSAAVVGDGNAGHCLSGVGTWVGCTGGGGTISAGPRPFGHHWFYSYEGGPGLASGVAAVTVNAAGSEPLHTRETASSANLDTTTVGEIVQAATGLVLSVTPGNRVSPINGSNIVDLQLLGYVYQTSTVRYWFGLLDANQITSGGATHNTAYQADNPTTTNTLAFRYSSAAGDTTWHCYASAGAGSTIADSSVAIDVTASHEFEIRQTTPGTILYLIDGTQVCSLNTNIPASPNYLYFMQMVDNLVGTGSTTVEFGDGYAYFETNK